MLCQNIQHNTGTKERNKVSKERKFKTLLKYSVSNIVGIGYGQGGLDKLIFC